VVLQSCIAQLKSLLDIFSTSCCQPTNQPTNGQTQKQRSPLRVTKVKPVNHGHPKRYYILGVKKRKIEKKKNLKKKKSKIFSKVEIFSKIKICSYKKSLLDIFSTSCCDQLTNQLTDSKTKVSPSGDQKEFFGHPKGRPLFLSSLVR